MKQSIDSLVEALGNANGYRNQSLAILDYLESNDVVRKGKMTQRDKECAALGGIYYDNDTIWKFLLQSPSALEYWDEKVQGSICAKNMCDNILQAVKERKIEVSPSEAEVFAKRFIDVIDLIFPEGQRNNLKVYEEQEIDFSLNFNEDRPSLYQIRMYRKYLFTTLITTLWESVNMSVAIKLFEKYSNKYNLSYRSIFVRVPEIKDLKEKLKPLSDFDLRYLLIVINTELTNYACRETAYLKTVKKLCDAGWKLKSDISCVNKGLSAEISDLNRTFESKELNEEQRYYLSILAREYEEFADKISNCDDDQYRKLSYGMRQIIAETKVPLEGEEPYKKFLYDLRQIIDQILTERENAYEIKLLEDFNKGESEFDEDELKELFIDFLKTCEKCKDYDEKKCFDGECQECYYQKECKHFPCKKREECKKIEGYKAFHYDKINYADLYDKVKKNKKIVKQIAAAQYRFSQVENLDLGDGDFTNLIAVQVKVIERYLKEVIVQNMNGETIYSKYKFEERTANASKYTIRESDSAEELSSPKFKIELATAGFIVGSEEIGWKLCGAVESMDENMFFCYKNRKTSSLKHWVDSVRNGYFHIHPVENMDKVREIHYKTAFCLMRCMSLLKPLAR